MTLTRRGILMNTLAAAIAVPSSAYAQDELAIERFPIWPASPPGGAGVSVSDTFIKRTPDGPPDDIAWTHVATPMLTAITPKHPNGAAMLVVPGGGYVRVAVGRAGSPIARSFAARGITTFELLYRLPHDHWAAGPDVSLQDAQRAMRLIRAGAGSRWDVDPRRVAI